ncbi:biotin transporter BioY [Viridibacillus sp. FSL R5-0477]|uniref:Biotin transporter n=1 Tax=Viridibacillus arenosi FSL R5-213 TaxID=1227360 RepID=W4F5C1_9BACL|nr:MULTISPECIES: biotin transporter BioY [Viridibacillus]ETT87464.1 BioY protein [Viridibacillus arenosi FSL R5-213]OMC82528.1 BioY family transporter [Viridibacillus sp. FSL H8-0123]OMC87729.1 BioY family transporter [Viridibacillus sp. FSL H7-0596]OMC91273.1 BioY family transporter [Viridibacillus arenosi]
MTTSTVNSKSKWRTVDLVYCALFATLMMIGANITSFAPFMVVGGVPITLQLFFAVLAGLVLGSRLGALSITVYMLIGLAGAPVFARFGGGFAQILSPTFGFIVAFILVAFIVGKIVENHSSKRMYITAAVVGAIVSYLIGTNWMYAAYMLWFSAPEGFTYKMAWLWMMPPLPKDLILAVFAGIFGHRLQKVLKVRQSR